MGGNYVRDYRIDLHHTIYHLAHRCDMCCRSGRDRGADGVDRCIGCTANTDLERVRMISRSHGGSDGSSEEQL